MKILLINHYAGSEDYGMEYRPYYLAREWIKAGHSVTIVGANFAHVRSRQPKVTKLYSTENHNGVSYIWLRTPSYSGNGLGRILNMLSFVSLLFLYALRIVRRNKPDVVIASSTYTLDNIPSYLMAKLAGARLVYEVHDLWPLSPMELGGMSRWHPAIMAMQFAENFAYRKADVVVSMLPKAIEHMALHGMKRSKFVHIPNGICSDDWLCSEKQTALPAIHADKLEELRRAGQFVVLYTGAHGVANALESFLLAAKNLRNQDVSLVLVGQGPEKQSLERLARDEELSSVYFLPSVPKSSIPLLLAQADALYIGLQRQSLFRFGVSPNKLLDYLMAGRPIVHAIEAGNDLVAESNSGVSVRAEDPQAIAEGMLYLKALSPEERATLGQNGRAFVLRKHEYSCLAAEFIDSIGVRGGVGDERGHLV